MDWEFHISPFLKSGRIQRNDRMVSSQLKEVQLYIPCHKSNFWDFIIRPFGSCFLDKSNLNSEGSRLFRSLNLFQSENEYYQGLLSSICQPNVSSLKYFHIDYSSQPQHKDNSNPYYFSHTIIQCFSFVNVFWANQKPIHLRQFG